jgi:hypothetical protein
MEPRRLSRALYPAQHRAASGLEADLLVQPAQASWRVRPQAESQL